MPYHDPLIVERREAGGLTLLRLHAPDLARAARPGQAVLVRCAPPGSDDPLLRRTFFPAGADAAAGTIELLATSDERGSAWVAAQPVGTRLDVYGPVGNGFTIDNRSRNIVLIGVGRALPAMLFLARTAVARAAEVVLLAAAATTDLLPPTYLLPSDVEYQSSSDGEAGLLALLAPVGRAALPALTDAPLAWADQVFLALPSPLHAGFADAVRAARIRWERGFAQVALAGAMPCGLGTCLACAVETRDGSRLLCKDGLVFDLRELRSVS